MRRGAMFLVATAGLAGMALLVLVGGLPGGGTDRSAADAVPAVVAVPTRDPPVALPSVQAGCTAGTMRRVGPRNTAVAVVVMRPTVVRHAPAGREIARFGLRNVNGVRTVLGVVGARIGSDCRPRWYRVQLPLRPNGTTGWVAASHVRRFVVHTRVVVDLSDRIVTVFRDDERVLRMRAAIGKASTPTPTGSYYVNQRLLASDPTGPWGPGGVGVSAFSPVLVDWAQGGPIAIHGTNQPYLIGDAVSNGCVRVSNYHLRQLMDIASEGTPVVIRA